MKHFFIVFYLLILYGCNDNYGDILLKHADCMKKYPKNQTTQKVEFEKCVNE